MGTDLKSTGMCLEAGRELQCTKQKTSPRKEQRIQCWRQADTKNIYIFLGPSLEAREGNCMGN